MANAPVVYFIATADRRYVKIGYTTNITKRLSAVRMGNPEPLDLLGTVVGDKTDEARWHHLYRLDRAQGEWFRLTPALLDSIEWACRPPEPEALFYL